MKNVFELNGTLLALPHWTSLRRPALALSMMLLASALGGCQTAGTLISVTDNEPLCIDPTIRYSRHDTTPTIVQVREHNAFRQRLGCKP